MAQQKWNLGDIRPPERAARTTRGRKMQETTTLGPRPTRIDVSDTHEEDDQHDDEVRPQTRVRKQRKSNRRPLFIIGIIVVLGILLFLTTIILRGADVTVYPKYEDVTVQATFTAHQNPAAGELGYELLTLEEVGERTVPATGSEEVEERAEGTITIYNAYSSDPQRLIKNTRFESTDGKIFRVSDSVVVPGYTEDASGKKIPGSITAEVFADAAGEEHNIAAGRFTIPGLKGSEQFDTMYGESQSPMTGGYIGTKLLVDEATLTDAQNTIHTELREKLIARLQNERPAGFVFYEGAVNVDFESLPSVDAGANDATIKEKGILSIPLFAEASFAQYLAQNTIPSYTGEPVRLENPQAMTFAYTATTSPEAALRDDNRLEFDLSGNVRVVWDYDENKLREDIAGASKGDLPSILANYPAIQRAATVIRPFWKRSFPESVQKIKIIEVLGEGS